ncbi:MAG: manganese efflux pump MntP family protein [Proteobacteria bacterium]|nr:manganese efflux pump MntP family protein [Pseudomonadota bacterium]MCL2307476.1 manganese efflux pump MntP family protein [Pseudomonadota bacterium]
MTTLMLLTLAFALATDAFAVAVTTGIQLKRVTTSQTLRMAGTFGGFQFGMPIIGWLLGASVHRYIEAIDHWVAFGLLVFVGGHMLKEAWEHRKLDEDAPRPERADPTRGRTLILLGIATSIDALAVGLSFAMINVSIWFPALVIGVVCFGATALGMRLGRWACTLGNLGSKATLVGGLVLIVIGISILREHGVF